MSDEVWVAGGGMAGAVAALRARSLGAEVRVFRRSHGATALSSGAVDVAADLTAPPGSPEPLEVDPYAAAAEIARTRPHHPYAILRGSLHRLREALAFTTGVLSELYPEPGDRNLLLPTPLGTLKPTALAQRSQVGGDFRTLPVRTAVLELPNLAQPDIGVVANGLIETARALSRRVELSVVRLEGFGRIADSSRTPAEWAAHLEREDMTDSIEALAAAIRRALPEGTEALLLPPIFGKGAIRRITELLAPIRLAELLSQAPSVPGLRLQAELDRVLRRERIAIEEVGFPADGRTPGHGGGRAVILATGKFLSGGLIRDGGFREPIFDLPVFIDGQVAPAPGERTDYVGRWLDRNVCAHHAAFRAGVRIDGALQPLGRDLRPAQAGLYAAGSIVAGYDPAVDKTGLGVALFTGFLAGEQAARLGSAGRSG